MSTWKAHNIGFDIILQRSDSDQWNTSYSWQPDEDLSWYEIELTAVI